MPSAMYFCPCNAPMYSWPKKKKEWSCMNYHTFMGKEDLDLEGIECVCLKGGDVITVGQTYKIRVEFPMNIAQPKMPAAVVPTATAAVPAATAVAPAT